MLESIEGSSWYVLYYSLHRIDERKYVYQYDTLSNNGSNGNDDNILSEQKRLIPFPTCEYNLLPMTILSNDRLGGSVAFGLSLKLDIEYDGFAFLIY